MFLFVFNSVCLTASKTKGLGFERNVWKTEKCRKNGCFLGILRTISDIFVNYSIKLYLWIRGMLYERNVELIRFNCVISWLIEKKSKYSLSSEFSVILYKVGGVGHIFFIFLKGRDFPLRD